MRPQPAARACRTGCRGGAAVKPSKPPQPAQNTPTWSGALDASPTGRTVGVADRRYAATAASPDPPASPTAASTCPAHCWPVWSSSGAVTVASARSNHAHGGDQKRRPKKCCDSTAQAAASERHAVLVRERFHDRKSCIRTGPDCSRPQLLSGRRFTRLTVTCHVCLRPAESRF